jgi:ribosome maturation factor RimP
VPKRDLQLEQLIEPAVRALGYELVGVEYMPQGRHSLLRIYIDSPHGIGLEDCEKVSHQVSGVLDVEDPVHGHYDLEVSSPGLDRPLFSPEHFVKYAGNTVKIRLQTPIAGQRNFTGVLQGMRGTDVVIVEDGVEHVLPHTAIAKAHVVPEYDSK